MFGIRNLSVILALVLTGCAFNGDGFDDSKYYQITEFNNDGRAIAVYYGFGRSMKYSFDEGKLQFVDRDGVKRTITNTVEWEIYERN